MKRIAKQLIAAASAVTLATIAACGTNGAAVSTSVSVPAVSGSSTSSSTGASSSTSSSPPSAAGSETAGTSVASGPLVDVKLQLQWFTQAQFGGYIAALDKGYYQAQGLNVRLLQGGADIVPQTVLANGQADFAIAWVPKALQSREQGAKITDVGQVFQRSGTRQVSFKSKNISAPADLKGKVVGNWGFGNEYELFAAMTKAGIVPGTDNTIAQQAFDMSGLLNGDIDAAQAMVYNEYAQVLEATNADSGALYQPSDLNVMNWNDVGTAMLQDAIWADTTKLSDPAYQATTVKFLTASYQGWIYCSTNAQDCRDMVVAAGSKLGASHQLWQMNEVNKLIWPSPSGIGMVDEAAWNQTVTIAQGTKNADGDTVLKAAPEGLAYTNDYTKQALTSLKGMGMDATGSSFVPLTVMLNAGGS